eukprot:TRINITY_DN3621_c0_g1_i3.p1 TRINITY_DN3621_c0_g1~~TRINITY_DN3621_c0_g1_i3.p1  ORF type:complete len:2229 (+),score=647.30 TRINITY_DN3621_c0_g1_i3:51-6689(+)
MHSPGGARRRGRGVGRLPPVASAHPDPASTAVPSAPSCAGSTSFAVDSVAATADREAGTTADESGDMDSTRLRLPPLSAKRRPQGSARSRSPVMAQPPRKEMVKHGLLRRPFRKMIENPITITESMMVYMSNMPHRVDHGLELPMRRGWRQQREAMEEAQKEADESVQELMREWGARRALEEGASALARAEHQARQELKEAERRCREPLREFAERLGGRAQVRLARLRRAQKRRQREQEEFEHRQRLFQALCDAEQENRSGFYALLATAHEELEVRAADGIARARRGELIFMETLARKSVQRELMRADFTFERYAAQTAKLARQLTEERFGVALEADEARQRCADSEATERRSLDRTGQQLRRKADEERRARLNAAREKERREKEQAARERVQESMKESQARTGLEEDEAGTWQGMLTSAAAGAAESKQAAEKRLRVLREALRKEHKQQRAELASGEEALRQSLSGDEGLLWLQRLAWHECVTEELRRPFRLSAPLHARPNLDWDAADDWTAPGVLLRRTTPPNPGRGHPAGSPLYVHGGSSVAVSPTFSIGIKETSNNLFKGWQICDPCTVTVDGVTQAQQVAIDLTCTELSEPHHDAATELKYVRTSGIYHDFEQGGVTTPGLLCSSMPHWDDAAGRMVLTANISGTMPGMARPRSGSTSWFPTASTLTSAMALPFASASRGTVAAGHPAATASARLSALSAAVRALRLRAADTGGPRDVGLVIRVCISLKSPAREGPAESFTIAVPVTVHVSTPLLRAGPTVAPTEPPRRLRYSAAEDPPSRMHVFDDVCVAAAHQKLDPEVLWRTCKVVVRIVGATPDDCIAVADAVGCDADGTLMLPRTSSGVEVRTADAATAAILQKGARGTELRFVLGLHQAAGSLGSSGRRASRQRRSRAELRQAPATPKEQDDTDPADDVPAATVAQNVTDLLRAVVFYSGPEHDDKQGPCKPAEVLRHDRTVVAEIEDAFGSTSACLQSTLAFVYSDAGPHHLILTPPGTKNALPYAVHRPHAQAHPKHLEMVAPAETNVLPQAELCSSDDDPVLQGGTVEVLVAKGGSLGDRLFIRECAGVSVSAEGEVLVTLGGAEVPVGTVSVKACPTQEDLTPAVTTGKLDAPSRRVSRRSFDGSSSPDRRAGFRFEGADARRRSSRAVEKPPEGLVLTLYEETPLEAIQSVLRAVCYAAALRPRLGLRTVSVTVTSSSLPAPLQGSVSLKVCRPLFEVPAAFASQEYCEGEGAKKLAHFETDCTGSQGPEDVLTAGCIQYEVLKGGEVTDILRLRAYQGAEYTLSSTHNKTLALSTVTHQSVAWFYHSYNGGTLSIHMNHQKGSKPQDVVGLLRGLTYDSDNRDPQELSKVLRVTVTDGYGGCTQGVVELRINPVNDPTELTLPRKSVRLSPNTRGQTWGCLVAEGAEMYDPDTFRIEAGGYLHVDIMSGGGVGSGDTLSLLTLEQQKSRYESGEEPGVCPQEEDPSSPSGQSVRGFDADQPLAPLHILASCDEESGRLTVNDVNVGHVTMKEERGLVVRFEPADAEVPLVWAAYILRLICFNNTNTPVKTGNRVISIRFNAGDQPVSETRATVTIEVVPPLLYAPMVALQHQAKEGDTVNLGVKVSTGLPASFVLTNYEIWATIAQGFTEDEDTLKFNGGKDYELAPRDNTLTLSSGGRRDTVGVMQKAADSITIRGDEKVRLAAKQLPSLFRAFQYFNTSSDPATHTRTIELGIRCERGESALYSTVDVQAVDDMTTINLQKQVFHYIGDTAAILPFEDADVMDPDTVYFEAPHSFMCVEIPKGCTPNDVLELAQAASQENALGFDAKRQTVQRTITTKKKTQEDPVVVEDATGVVTCGGRPCGVLSQRRNGFYIDLQDCHINDLQRLVRSVAYSTRNMQHCRGASKLISLSVRGGPDVAVTRVAVGVEVVPTFLELSAKGADRENRTAAVMLTSGAPTPLITQNVKLNNLNLLTSMAPVVVRLTYSPDFAPPGADDALLLMPNAKSPLTIRICDEASGDGTDSEQPDGPTAEPGPAAEVLDAEKRTVALVYVKDPVPAESQPKDGIAGRELEFVIGTKPQKGPGGRRPSKGKASRQPPPSVVPVLQLVHAGVDGHWPTSGVQSASASPSAAKPHRVSITGLSSAKPDVFVGVLPPSGVAPVPGTQFVPAAVNVELWPMGGQGLRSQVSLKLVPQSEPVKPELLASPVGRSPRRRSNTYTMPRPK